MSNIVEQSQQIFEDLKRYTADSQEYWSARDLKTALGYQEWRKFEGVIKKAKAACLNSGYAPENHFVGADKMVEIGSGTEREVDDYHLTRYACYLVSMNGDPRKPKIAAAQTYFALKAREAEVVIPAMQQQAPPPAAALPSAEQRLKTIELGMSLLDRLGGADDRTKLALKDVVRNLLLEDKLKQPLLSSGEATERLEWNISDRVLHLGYRAKPGELTKIGKVAAQLYREQRGGEPPKREQYVGGTTRMVNCYGSGDLDILDEAITRVLAVAAG